MERFPEELLRATAPLICGDEAVVRQLKQILASRKRARHPMAASLLHAAQPSWRPADGRAPLLSGAYLAGVRWPGIRFGRLDITAADMTNSDLSEAQLNNVSARLAQLSGIRLHGARLSGLSASKATLVSADLSHVRAPQANFEGAILERANLEARCSVAPILSMPISAGATSSAWIWRRPG